MQHVGAVGANHETGGRGGDRIVLGLLIGGRAHEGDRAGDAIADRVRLDVEPGLGRPLIVDAQVERRNRAAAIERELHGHAAAFVEKRGDHAAMDHAGLDIADKDRLVGQAGPGFAGPGAIDGEPAGAAIQRQPFGDRLGELFERQRLSVIGRDFGHAAVLDEGGGPRKS